MRRYLATPVQFIENTDLPRLRQGSVFSGGVSQQWGTDGRRGRVAVESGPVGSSCFVLCWPVLVG